MAKLVFGPVVLDARGKVGGVVFSKSKAGAIGRKKVSPSQPRTTSQSTVRSDFTELSKAWSSVLTDTQRAGWISLAKNNPVHDVFGATIVLTGLQMYQRLNRALSTIGQARIDDPPVNLFAESAGAVTVVADSVAPTLTILPSKFNTAISGWVISAAPLLSAGRASVGTKQSVVKHGVTVLAAAQSFLTEYVAKFGDLIPGLRLFASISYTNKTTGAQGLPSLASVIVT